MVSGGRRRSASSAVVARMMRIPAVFALALLAWCGGVWCHAHAMTCRASFYGAESGRRTANGELFAPWGKTVALRSYAFGGRYRACYHGCVIVRHTDYGPARWTHRCADLSKGAAAAIGMLHAGVATISIEKLGR